MHKFNQDVFVDTPVVVLAGGLGTRLQKVVADRPKILAPIGGTPFLALMLQWLVNQKVKKVCFSLGYMADLVIAQLQKFAEQYPIDVWYVVEKTPQGTLGGLSLALNKLDVHETIVMNGDTFVNVHLANFIKSMREKNQKLGLVATQVNDVSRYGQLLLDENDMIIKFIEKDLLNNGKGWINAGVYYFSENMIEQIKEFSNGSIEFDFLMPHCKLLHAFRVSQGGFIDIGTPQSYQQAPKVLQEYLK
jgi:D-glycero-alpha-D-manno-heptose 1-phosphate guanylyltransferase